MCQCYFCSLNSSLDFGLIKDNRLHCTVLFMTLYSIVQVAHTDARLHDKIQETRCRENLLHLLKLSQILGFSPEQSGEMEPT